MIAECPQYYDKKYSHICLKVSEIKDKKWFFTLKYWT